MVVKLLEQMGRGSCLVLPLVIDWVSPTSELQTRNVCVTQ